MLTTTTTTTTVTVTATARIDYTEQKETLLLQHA